MGILFPDPPCVVQHPGRQPLPRQQLRPTDQVCPSDNKPKIVQHPRPAGLRVVWTNPRPPAK